MNGSNQFYFAAQSIPLTFPNRVIQVTLFIPLFAFYLNLVNKIICIGYIELSFNRYAFGNTFTFFWGCL